MLTSDDQLRLAVENALRASPQPMLSLQLFAMPSVNKHTKSVFSVANCLATLWREGHLTRIRLQDQHSRDGKVSWAYGWKHQANVHLPLDEKSSSRGVRIDATQQNVTTNPQIASLPEILETVRGSASWCSYISSLKNNA